MTKEEFAKELYALMLSKGKEPNKAMATVWYEDLKVLADDQIKTAFSKLRRSSCGFPNVGQVFEIVNPPIDVNAEAERAWEIALACSSYGRYSKNSFIHDVVNSMGGPDSIGYAEGDYALESKHREFVKMYADLITRTPDYIALPLAEVKQALPLPAPEPLPCTPEQAEKNKGRVAEIISGIGEKKI